MSHPRANAAIDRDHVAFAARLTRALADGPGREFVWSPYSVAAALALLATGARGATQGELQALLGADLDAELALLDGAVAEGPEIAAHTSLWVRSDVPVEPDFEARLRTRPASGLHHADFAAAPEQAVRAVNAEVATTTRGRIPHLLDAGAITPDTAAVLVNALWVKLAWAAPFEPAKTRTVPFHAPSGRRGVPMMHRTGRLPYAQTGRWRMVTLEAGHDLAMDVVLPREPAGASAALTADDLRALYAAQGPTEVRLALPRFELRWRRELSDALSACGVTTVFGRDADLAGISSAPLRLDAVVHESWLRVDERGAEGAAGTAAMMVLMGMPSRPVEFTADRPFRVVLRRGGVILFLGHIADPQDPGPADA
jgi:serine protease inhibitor